VWDALNSGAVIIGATVHIVLAVSELILAVYADGAGGIAGGMIGGTDVGTAVVPEGVI